VFDKTVIITGGNSGLGYECAKAIGNSMQGWNIVIAGRSKIICTPEELMEV
jgi:NAD(P)-dependent dehydrogenase (short-subunit alcohol dehydrogenase family)